MEQVLEHICCEDEIKTFHQWISELCNPDSPIVQNSSDKFKTITEEQSMQTMTFKDASATGLMTSTNLDSVGTTTTAPAVDGQNLLRSLANKYVSIISKIYICIEMFKKAGLYFQNCYGNTIKGAFRIRGSEDAVFEGHVDQHQKPHGFCRVISPNGDVEFFGCFLYGRLIGNCWKSLLGGK